MPRCQAVSCGNMTGVEKNSYFRIPNPNRYKTNSELDQGEQDRVLKWFSDTKRGWKVSTFLIFTKYSFVRRSL